MRLKYFTLFRSHIFRSLSLICLCLIAGSAVFSQTPDPKLVELRKQFATEYLNPAAHFALANYYLEKGDKVQAFFIMEYARRYRFAQEDFDKAFINFFQQRSIEPNAAAKEALDDGYRFLKENDLAAAEQSFVKAAKLAPNSALTQAFVGRFFFKAKSNNAQALPYYFKAYFLDPHAYETEYVESRIRNITFADAEIQFKEFIKNGKTLEQISTNSNPLIVGQAIDQMAKQWKPEYVKTLLECMANDDSSVRWMAFTVIFRNAEASSDQMISILLNDSDLRKRGLAAYAIVQIQKEKGFDTLKKMLNDDAELIRFDAVSALVLGAGSQGLEIIREHQANEPSRRLKELISKALEKK